MSGCSLLVLSGCVCPGPRHCLSINLIFNRSHLRPRTLYASADVPRRTFYASADVPRRTLCTSADVPRRTFYASADVQRRTLCTSADVPRRTLCTSAGRLKKSGLEIFKSKFISEKDANKRPSDLEIKEKDLPPNQPTLRERVERDRWSQFHQFDVKNGYWTNGKPLPVMEQMKIELKRNPKEAFQQSFAVVKKEVEKWREEVRGGEYDIHRTMRDNLVLPGQRRREWGFQSDLELDEWVLTKDSDWGEGYSSAEFELNNAGTSATLRGELSTRKPNDGRTEEAGYVNIASVNKRKSFGRLKLLNHWENYTHLTMNVRGDGRKYMINLKVKREFDVTWDDRWHYPLFTRGGPYWQYVKIPFSKFYFGFKGRIQDKQHKVPLVLMQGMSITLMDRISGPFQLEIKDVSLHSDPFWDDEKFAYEMYKVPDFWLV